MAHGKRYTEAAGLVDRDTVYAPEAATDLVKATSTVKFDPTIEAHLRLGVDPAPAHDRAGRRAESRPVAHAA